MCNVFNVLVVGGLKQKLDRDTKFFDLILGIKTSRTQPTGIDWNNLVETVFKEEISNFAQDLNSLETKKKTSSSNQ